MSSAMSASSPPTGLMPLSLISEHKTAVPGVPLQRTPEKVSQQQQPVGPTPALPLQAGQPPRVANGMEGPTPQAAPYPHQQEPSHPSPTVEAPGVAVPPAMHYPNIPSAAKGEAASAPPQEHKATPEVKNTPLGQPTVEGPLPEIRLSTASGLTITPIGIPVSQPVPATPPSLPVPAVQPPQSVAQPVQPVAAVVAAPPPALVTQPVVLSGPPPPKEAPLAPPPALQPHNVGGSQLAPPRPTEPKPVVQPERGAEKPVVLPPAENDKPAQPAAIPTSFSQSSPPPAAQGPPSAPKPTTLPSEPAATPPVQPEAKPAPPVETSPVKLSDAAAAQPAPTPPTPAVSNQAEPSAAAASEPAAASGAADPATTPQSTKPKRTPKPKPAPDVVEKKTPAKETPTDKDGEGKPRRKRLPTQPYQSPIPELNLIAKITKVEKTPAKPQEDKLIVFYRNEFLAVRNAEGSYYVCQAMQNIYKGSSKIKIRWLSQDPNGGNYSPDFYDHTEFDCILTNLNLQRMGKDQFKLPEVEAKRTDSILKRAIDVEKGIVKPDESNITEEHPDGLDLSLYRNEDQLKKRKTSKRSPRAAKSTRKSSSRTPKPAKPTPEPSKKLPGRSAAAAKRKSAPSPPVSSKRAAPVLKKESVATPAKKEAPKKEPATPVAKSAAKRKAVATPASAPPADKRSRRDPASKTKSAAAAASASTPKPSSTSTTTSRRPTRNSK